MNRWEVAYILKEGKLEKYIKASNILLMKYHNCRKNLCLAYPQRLL